MVWIKEEMNGDPPHSERVSQHRQAVAPAHRLEATPKVALGRRSQLLSTKQKLAWLMLGLVSGAWIAFVAAWWSGFNELVGGTGIKQMVSSLTKHRQFGGLPAQPFTTEEAEGDLKHGLISRLESLPPTAAGMEDDTALVAGDKDNSRNPTSSEHHPEEDNLSVASEHQPNETISDTGTAISTVPIPDDLVMRLQKLAESGDAKAQFKLGMMYRIGEGVPKNPAKAAEWLENAAAQGNANAQYNLGMMCRVGDGVPENSAKAAEWFEKAAAQGNVNAQYNLGVMYDTGDGVPIKPVKALEWFQKAAAQGDTMSQNKLGMMYSTGDGVPVDSGKAMEWFHKSATRGYSNAQYNLGMMYATGEGVPKNVAKAATWFKKAAAQGDADAQFRLGVMYRIGEGVPKNAAKAIEWFKKAAAQGNSDAQFNLGMMHHMDEGISMD